MEMTALSLFFFNLLPVWHLDGMQLLTILLNMGSATVTAAYVDPENQRGSSSERSRWATRTLKIVSGGIGLLMGVNLLLQIYHLL
jgi:membrane-associated protease RseP (regulator of RpoE activity)